MDTDKRQITLYYNPNRLADRQTLAYAQTVAPHVAAFSFEDAQLNATRWEELLELMDMADPRMLLNEGDSYFQAHLAGRDFDRMSWLKILSHSPNLIKAPIAVRGDEAVLCCMPKCVMRLVEESAFSD